MTGLRRFLFVAITFGAAACATPPRPATELPETPASWSAVSGRGLDGGAAADPRWWESFGDEILSDLVRRATSGNPGLAVATARVLEARALAGVAAADRLPSIDARGGSSRTRRSEDTDGGDVGRRMTGVHETGFDVSWEVDLYGRAAMNARAAEADAEAVEADRRGALLSLRAEVVRSYASLRGAQRLRAVLVSSVQAAATTAELTRVRQAGGLANELDVARADAQHAAVQAEVPPVDASIAAEIHRLSILCGELPTTLAPLLAAPGPLPATPPRVLVGVPAETLARRPDLRREALRVEAEEARAGVARADLYPRISLAAALGFDAEHAGDLVSASARTWSIARSVRWPAFDGGRTRRGIHAADARLGQARAAHREAYLAALGEVEDALTGYLRGWERRDALASSVASRRRAVALAADIHRAGIADFLDVLDAERSLYDAEAELARTETETATRLVALHKSLGGGEE